ncbi:MAG: methionyl-tRNA formyltransferase [Anaerolineae bacterium]
MRVLYFGLTGEFSLIPMQALLASGTAVCGVVVPENATADAQPIVPLPPRPRPSSLPMQTTYAAPNIIHLAWAHNIPAFAMRRAAHPETEAVLASLQPDVACVACFTHRIPVNLLALPPHGFLNLHPSLLPAYRGPSPLFWQLRRGETETGVTIHFMDEGLDTGDIAAQARVDFPEGADGAALDRLLASKGSDLLWGVLGQLHSGHGRRRPQPAGDHAQPSPQAADFRLDTRWPARRAFNFMRGTAEWGRPYPVTVAGQALRLKAAVSYDPDAFLAQPLLREGNTLSIQFTPGVLRAVAYD